MKIHRVRPIVLSFCTYYNYGTDEGDKKPAFDIPDIREYFVDLEYVLGVIADGPTKSFAYRRLKYLSGKFTMYSLLSEFQELADMKVRRYLTIAIPLFTFPVESAPSVCDQHEVALCPADIVLETSTTCAKSIPTSITQAA